MKRSSTTKQQQLQLQGSSRSSSSNRTGFGVKRAPQAMLLAFVFAALTIGQASAFTRIPPPSSPSTDPRPPSPPPPPPPAAVPTSPPSPLPTTGGDDDDDGSGGFGQDQPCDASWNSTAVQYSTNLEKWGSPDCYVFTIQRLCFCTDVVRNPADVRVENGTIVSPTNYEELFLLPMKGLFDQVNDLCVKNCPDQGAARCDISYGPDGNLASAYIDRSEMIADEEISYTITNYRACPTPGNRNRRLRRTGH
jgi:Family of unknown function (DUF6174)